MPIAVNIVEEGLDKVADIKKAIEKELDSFSKYFIECRVPPPSKYELLFLQNYLLWKIAK